MNIQRISTIRRIYRFTPSLQPCDASQYRLPGCVQCVHLGRLTVEVRQDDALVVRRRQQVVGGCREADGADVGRVRAERLQHALATHVPQHARRILVPGREQTAGVVDAQRRERAACNTRQRLHTATHNKTGVTLTAICCQNPWRRHPWQIE